MLNFYVPTNRITNKSRMVHFYKTIDNRLIIQPSIIFSDIEKKNIFKTWNGFFYWKWILTWYAFFFTSTVNLSHYLEIKLFGFKLDINYHKLYSPCIPTNTVLINSGIVPQNGLCSHHPHFNLSANIDRSWRWSFTLFNNGIVIDTEHAIKMSK